MTDGAFADNVDDPISQDRFQLKGEALIPT